MNKFKQFGGANVSIKKAATPKEMASADLLLSEEFMQVATIFEDAFKSEKISFLKVMQLNSKAKDLGPAVTDMIEEIINRASQGDLTILENPIVAKIYNLIKG